MFSQLIRKEFPVPSLPVFFSLQILDVLTTVIGLSMGAQEASVFVGRLLTLGPIPGLVIAKLLALILVTAAIAFKRARVIVFVNYWFAGVVTWNLITIFRCLRA